MVVLFEEWHLYNLFGFVFLEKNICALCDKMCIAYFIQRFDHKALFAGAQTFLCEANPFMC